MKLKEYSSFLVALAAILWASDTLFRFPLVKHNIDSTWIVFIEHAICLTLIAPWILFIKGKKAFRLTANQWIALAVIGGGASAAATVLFTASFQYVNPSVSILVQKLQPIFVVVLARLLLQERATKRFFFWAVIALSSGLVLSFPTLQFGFGGNIDPKGSFYALGAAALWGLATVIGKSVLEKLSPSIVTFWRFAFGFIALALTLFAMNGTLGVPSGEPVSFEAWEALFYIAIGPGLLAMLLYYKGMSRSSAMTTTFMELLFPVTAVGINTFYLEQPLNPIQGVSALVLLIAVTMISIGDRKLS